MLHNRRQTLGLALLLTGAVLGSCMTWVFIQLSNLKHITNLNERMVVVPSGKPHTLDVIIRTEKGSPREGVLVSVQDESAGQQERTDAYGRASFTANNAIIAIGLYEEGRFMAKRNFFRDFDTENGLEVYYYE